MRLTEEFRYGRCLNEPAIYLSLLEDKGYAYSVVRLERGDDATSLRVGSGVEARAIRDAIQEELEAKGFDKAKRLIMALSDDKRH